VCTIHRYLGRETYSLTVSLKSQRQRALDAAAAAAEAKRLRKVQGNGCGGGGGCSGNGVASSVLDTAGGSGSNIAGRDGRCSGGVDARVEKDLESGVGLEAFEENFASAGTVRAASVFMVDRAVAGLVYPGSIACLIGAVRHIVRSCLCLVAVD